MVTLGAARACVLVSGAGFALRLALPTYVAYRIAEPKRVGNATVYGWDGPFISSLFDLGRQRPEVLILVSPPIVVTLLLLLRLLFSKRIPEAGGGMGFLSGLGAFGSGAISLFGTIFVIGGWLMGFQPFSWQSLLGAVYLLVFGFLSWQAWRIARAPSHRRPDLQFLVCLALYVLMCCPAWEWFVVTEFRHPALAITSWFWIGVASWSGMIVGIRLMILAALRTAERRTA